MSSVDSVHPQLLQAVRVVVAGIALQVNRIADGHTFQAPFIAFSALFDVGHQLVLLHMLVCFAVQLEVGLELSGVVAQLALVRVAQHGAPLLLWQTAFSSHMHAKHIQVVSGEAVAHSTLKELEGGIAGLRQTFSQGHQFLGHQLPAAQPHIHGNLCTYWSAQETHMQQERGKGSKRCVEFIHVQESYIC